jgi:hypothetical protein
MQCSIYNIAHSSYSIYHTMWICTVTSRVTGYAERMPDNETLQNYWPDSHNQHASGWLDDLCGGLSFTNNSTYKKNFHCFRLTQLYI